MDIAERLQKENKQLHKQLEEISTKHERLVFSTMADQSLRDKEIERLREAIKHRPIAYAFTPEAAQVLMETKRLREALQKIASIDYRGPIPDGVLIARKALEENKQ